MSSSRKLDKLRQTLNASNSTPSFQNIDRMTKSKVYTKQSKKKEELKNPVDKNDSTPSNNNEVFLINKILEKKIEENRLYFKKHHYLAKPSIEPDHLTILSESFAAKTADLIANNLNKQSNTFIEYQPGTGLITKHLLRNQKVKQDLKNIILIEPRKEYLNYLNDIKADENNSKHKIDIEKGQPFKMNFSTYKHSNFYNQSVVSIYGILPWSLKGYLRYIYQNFCFGKSCFSYKNLPEYFLYVPEHIVARLQPELKENFIYFNSALSVYSSILSKVEVLTQHDSQDFYPYPLIKALNSDREMRFPQNLVNYKNMYLIHIKFDTGLILQQDRGKFFHLIHQLWSQPNVTLSDALKCICGIDHIKELKKKLNFNIYKQVRQLHSFQFYQLFELLIKDSCLSSLNSSRYEKLLSMYDNSNEIVVVDNNKKNDTKVKENDVKKNENNKRTYLTPREKVIIRQ
jgi:phospholipid N-methyltransferase